MAKKQQWVRQRNQMQNGQRHKKEFLRQFPLNKAQNMEIYELKIQFLQKQTIHIKIKSKLSICLIFLQDHNNNKMERGAHQIKDDSLLSNLSNVSYQGELKQYHGNEFFKQSQPPGYFITLHNQKQIKEEQVDPSCLTSGFISTTICPTIFTTQNWISEGGHAEGKSDVGESEHVKLQELEEYEEKEEDENEKADSQRQEKQNQIIGTVIKNQTKNIPKNYGKAIITYIEKYQKKFQPILDECGIQYEDLLEELSKKKKTINTIANLRQLWVDFKHARCMRILSNHFLRKHALQYIFNSRICNYTSHVKYRKRLEEAIETPKFFCHIKQY